MDVVRDPDVMLNVRTPLVIEFDGDATYSELGEGASGLMEFCPDSRLRLGMMRPLMVCVRSRSADHDVIDMDRSSCLSGIILPCAVVRDGMGWGWPCRNACAVA